MRSVMKRQTAPSLKAAVFDMDGLIFNSERIVQRTWQDAGEVLGYPDLGEQIYHTIGFNRARRAEYFKKVYGEDFPYALFVEKAAARFQEIVDTEGLPVKPGVRELMTALKENGISIGLATSASGDYAKASLEEAGLWHFFDGWIFGNMVPRSKPDPEVYIKACQAIEVLPEYAVALEDAPSGVISASAAGLRVIMVPDLVEPEQEIRAKAWMVKPSLTDVLDELREEGVLK